MNIGLVGYGKMGSEIFSLLFDTVKDADITVISQHDTEKSREGIEKLLARQLKRKRISQEVYDAKCKSFRFTDDYNALSGCDIVIESAYEDMNVKKDIFSKLDKIVPAEALLLTNTSSLDIAEVFSGNSHPERCLGMHFFYPVKLSGFVELNYLPENTAEVLDKAEALITASGKRALRFAGEYHIYLNQILALCISHSIRTAGEAGATAEEFDSAVKEYFPFAGPFAVLDTVSLGLMAKNPEGFRISRNASLLRCGYDIMNGWIEKGYPAGSGELLDYMKEVQTSSGCDTSGFAGGVIALILNAAVFAANESGCEKEALLDAAADVLGLAKKLPEYYSAMGYETVKTELDRLYAETGFEVYIAAEKADFDKIYV